MGGNTQNLHPVGSLNNIQAAQLVGEFLSTKGSYLRCLGEGPNESCFRNFLARMNFAYFLSLKYIHHLEKSVAFVIV